MANRIMLNQTSYHGAGGHPVDHQRSQGPWLSEGICLRRSRPASVSSHYQSDQPFGRSRPIL